MSFLHYGESDVKISSHFELDVFSKAADAAMELFEVSKAFPREDIY